MIRLLLCLIVVVSACMPTEAKPLDEVTVDNFKTAFNDASGQVRLVALLSPT